MKSTTMQYVLVAALFGGEVRVVTTFTNHADALTLREAARAHNRNRPPIIEVGDGVIDLRAMLDDEARESVAHEISCWVSMHPLLAWVPPHELANIEEVEAVGVNPYVGHSDDAAVLSFATEMANVMRAKRDEGRTGWESSATCSANRLRALFFQSLARGHLVHTANYAMMLHLREDQGGIPALFFQDDFIATAQAVLKRVSPQTEITNAGMRDVARAFLEAVARGAPGL